MTELEVSTTGGLRLREAYPSSEFGVEISEVLLIEYKRRDVGSLALFDLHYVRHLLLHFHRRIVISAASSLFANSHAIPLGLVLPALSSPSPSPTPSSSSPSSSIPPCFHPSLVPSYVESIGIAFWVESGRGQHSHTCSSLRLDLAQDGRTRC
jgi:hypothetical protein